MADITLIPMEELLADREESREDIRVCDRAILLGIETYSGGRVADRLRGNREIIARIEAELLRREAPDA